MQVGDWFLRKIFYTKIAKRIKFTSKIVLKNNFFYLNYKKNIIIIYIYFLKFKNILPP